MLQPLQLEEVSIRYAEEIAELHDFLSKSGLPVNAQDALGAVTARLREDRAFRRDLKSHVWVALHASGRQISYSDLLGILAIAAAGKRFAATADDDDAHDLLRFLMQARSSFDLAPETQNLLPARRLAEPRSAPLLSLATQEDSRDRRPFVWVGAATCLSLVLLLFLLFHHPSTTNQAKSALVVSQPIPKPSPAIVAANRDEEPDAVTVSSARRNPGRPGTHRTARTSSSVEANLYRATPSASTAATNSFSEPRSTSAPLAAIAKRSTTENPNSPGLLRRSPLATSNSYAKRNSNVIGKEEPTDGSGTSGSKASTSAARSGFVRSTSLGIMAANVLYSPAPTYPPAASSLHVQGEVKLEAEVDREGNVVSTRIISGPPLLQEAAADAVQRWHYRPYLYDGKPIGMNATVVLDFELPSI